MPDKSKKRYVVAMSGGVDSSVAAALMVEQGHEVIGITLQLAPSRAFGRVGSCCAGADIDDARAVTRHLNIPHYVLNFEQSFKKHVIDDFVSNYMEGKTPVPCVRCNQKVKFKDLLAIARRLKADGLVTGHYARIHNHQLCRAIDESRDQSYFLFATTMDELSYLSFPLGEMLKKDVRKTAHRLDLPNADKAESQDLCFVSEGHYSDVIKKLHPSAGIKGDIIHIDGTKLGTHNGIEKFTIGQRRGLDIGGRYHPSQEKFYVISIDAELRHVIVGPREALATEHIAIHDIHWMGTQSPPQQCDIPLMIQWRSPQKPEDAILRFDNETQGQLKIMHKAYGIAAGQVCVFYDKEQLLGGGWITKPLDRDHSNFS